MFVSHFKDSNILVFWTSEFFQCGSIHIGMLYIMFREASY